MENKKVVVINDSFFSFEDFVKVVFGGYKIKISNEVINKLSIIRRKIDDNIRDGETIYGVNTGLGALADRRIHGDTVKEFQLNLLRSHAVGTGEYVGDEISKAVLLLRIVSLSKGHSGIRPQIIRLLEAFFNSGAVALIPKRGSVGASGDLAPLSHLALALIGDDDGAAKFMGKIYRGEALRRLLIEHVYSEFLRDPDFSGVFEDTPPLVKLDYKEGLALNNGTAFSAGILGYVIYRFEKLIDIADLNLALSLEALSGFIDAFDERFFSLGDQRYEHPSFKTTTNVKGILEGENGSKLIHRAKDKINLSELIKNLSISENLLEIELDEDKLLRLGILGNMGKLVEAVQNNLESLGLESFGVKRNKLYFKLVDIEGDRDKISELLDKITIKVKDLGLVQDAYSLRCGPQVHGSVRRALSFAKTVFIDEINLPNDNPLFFLNEKNGVDAISGGNFHGQSLALACDTLAIAIATLGNISERRIFRILDPNLNRGLKAFLAENPGLNSGFMITQYLAAELTAQLRQLANPISVHNIPTSANQEDFVSMSATAALRLLDMLDILETILAVELLVNMQALSLKTNGNRPSGISNYASSAAIRLFEYLRDVMADVGGFPVRGDVVLKKYIDIVKDRIYDIHQLIF